MLEVTVKRMKRFRSNDTLIQKGSLLESCKAIGWQDEIEGSFYALMGKFRRWGMIKIIECRTPNLTFTVANVQVAKKKTQSQGIDYTRYKPR